jgi:hypothetical protein
MDRPGKQHRFSNSALKHFTIHKKRKRFVVDQRYQAFDSVVNDMIALNGEKCIATVEGRA